MREYSLVIDEVKNPIYPALINMTGESPQGHTIDFTNYYMRYDKKPFFVICGEAHFSRMNQKLWEDEILKMKMGGLNVIATYVFWIHHEEIEGEFDWSGNKNLKLFLELCKKHDMKVILRIGPFDHGECRNGGYPDWIFGRPFDVRSNDPEYLRYTSKLFQEIGKQAKGLMFQDGGPVIAIQLENEYEHASAPWEMTTENSKEWVPSGAQGGLHLERLKELAKEAGLVTPFYTSTAWGGSCAPAELVLPLWGGYAFRPWIFYGDIKEHPATAEYLMNDFHNNKSPQYYNFDPEYEKEDLPFACCEMGGGMTVFYQYRFQLPFESVSAMSAVKVAGGCNFLGYYMYHGGTNPSGKRVPYLNENAVPKFSYDYQAPLGEFGQVRESYKRLKLQHLLYSNFPELVCGTKTFLPEEADRQMPEETDTLRYAVRVNEVGEGFLFVNNYQDHAILKDKRDVAIYLNINGTDRRFPESGGVDIKAGECAIFPMGLTLGGVYLDYATTQLITVIENMGELYYFFYGVDGTRCEYALDAEILELTNGQMKKPGVIEVSGEEISEIVCVGDGKKVHICTIPWEQALNLWQFEYENQKYLMITEAAVLADQNQIRLECNTDMGDIHVKVFPSLPLSEGLLEKGSPEVMFKGYHLKGKDEIHCCWEDKSSSRKEVKLKRPVVGSPITSGTVVNARASVNLLEEGLADYKNLFLKVDYEGDIGYAFTDGQMIHDNFSNQSVWDIDIRPYLDQILKKGMYLYISPRKKGVQVHSESEMAARFETAEEQIAEIKSIQLVGVYDVLLLQADEGC